MWRSKLQYMGKMLNNTVPFTAKKLLKQVTAYIKMLGLNMDRKRVSH